MSNLPIAIEAISLENAPSIYKADGLTPFLAHIKEQVSGEVPDLTTKKGRDRIASLSSQVSRSKTAVEKPGREYLKHLKELPKTIEAELREFVNACDALRDEIRKPLTDWEQAEEDRVNSLKMRVQSINDYLQIEGLQASGIQVQIDNLEAVVIADDFQEFEAEAHRIKASTLQFLRESLAIRQAYEAEQAELENLRRLQAEREQKEREERLMREAAEAAKLAAEQAAARQREAAERAERERQLESERREMQLKLQAEQAERQRIEAEQRAAYELQQAEMRAQQAAANERRRIEQEQAAAKAEADRQAANKAHRTAVNREILAALMEQGIAEDVAKLVITQAAKGLLGRMVINY